MNRHCVQIDTKRKKLAEKVWMSPKVSLGGWDHVGRSIKCFRMDMSDKSTYTFNNKRAAFLNGTM